MVDKQTQAAKRLAKKLTALRQTLRKDEREILDQLVAHVEPEVQGHTALTSAANANFQVVDGAYNVVTTVLT